MMIACSACGRPVPLSRDEIALLAATRGSSHGISLSALPAALAGCVRTLVRMGYVIRTANDDGASGRMVLITDRGLNWLAANLTA